MSFNDIKIEDYTDRSFVVNGETRKYKEDLKKLGGKYNGNLKNGPGWIFPKSSESSVKNFIKEGKRIVTEEEVKAGEDRSQQRSKEWAESRDSKNTKGSHMLAVSSIGNSSPTLTEYGALVNQLSIMSKKIDLLEHAMLMLLTDEQKTTLKTLMSPDAPKENKVKNSAKNVQSYSEDDEDVAVPKRRLMR
jgi:hypothetical protein